MASIYLGLRILSITKGFKRRKTDKCMTCKFSEIYISGLGDDGYMCYKNSDKPELKSVVGDKSWKDIGCANRK